jgi:glycosyltransferase involved in cell wall biosynthesis
MIELTIGMATYNDFDGVYFTLQALRLYHDLKDTELLVVDNYGCDDTKSLVEQWIDGKYILAKDVVGTAAPRDLVFRKAQGEAVLCCDCHVLFPPGVISRLKNFYRDNPDCNDLLQGPLLYDDAKNMSTHFDPIWREHMWGTWGKDPRGLSPDGEPFDIPMQGLGAFSCRRNAWLGFNPRFRGFGGEEGYIHEKFRQAGRRCLCIPWFRWMHRFERPHGIKFPLTVEDKIWNYVIGHAELGLDLKPVIKHFSESISLDKVLAVTEEALGICVSDFGVIY